MGALSKSKLIAYLQCSKRLWLEIHHPQLREDSAKARARFEIGYQVGDIARKLYDPKGKGEQIDFKAEGQDAAFARSKSLLDSSQPIFEAGFATSGALAYADVMLPVRKAGQRAWRMVEVKSATEVKDYHRDDVAIQAFVAREAKVPLVAVALAHIDRSWTYPGDDDYHGLFVENDLTKEAFSRKDEVKKWIAEAQIVARKRKAPDVCTGKHCTKPFECGFFAYCTSQEPECKYPVGWLPDVRSKALRSLIEDEGVRDMRKVPDELLNEQQLRVKTHSLSGKPFFDVAGAAEALSPYKLPAYFIDFETIRFAVPIWKGTRPYQQIPFQFSVHRLSRTGKLDHESFLDLSGDDPSRKFAEELIRACGERGPVFVYNAAFEITRIKELAERFPRLKRSLLAINERIVDLLKVAENHYYHPSQKGSWSIKKVLPAVAPDLRYDELEGVQNGEMAMDAYIEAISEATAAERKNQIGNQLTEYCHLDTLAMVYLWKYFTR